MKKIKQTSCFIAVMAALQAGAGVCAEPAPVAARAHAQAHWEYTGRTGPAHWSEVDEKFGACSQGKTQSPIDLRSGDAQPAALPEIAFDYQPSALKLVDNGHTVQVNYAPGSAITVAGKRYELLQFHFHKPSEERLNGKPYALVAHLVHKSAEGDLAVVGVLMEAGQRRPVLQAVFDNLPQKKGTEVAVPGVAIDIGALLPENRGYYTFAGSLTTPPCSEGVTWYVMKTPVQVAAADIARFGHVYRMNARPVQPLNGRVVSVSQ